jgi:hypothetical protein
MNKVKMTVEHTAEVGKWRLTKKPGNWYEMHKGSTPTAPGESRQTLLDLKAAIEAILEV